MFSSLSKLVEFLAKDPDSWKSRDDFKAPDAILTSQAVTNDHAERDLALIQDATKFGWFKSEKELPHVFLHVIEQNRTNHRNAKNPP